jgi:hypothetical protein
MVQATYLLSDRGACPRIASSELVAGATDTVDIRFTSDQVADWNALAVSVRYSLPDGNPLDSVTVTAQLLPNN